MSDIETQNLYFSTELYPHTSENMYPIANYKIGNKILLLYKYVLYKNCQYVMYWQNETDSIQHNMSEYEVFKLIEEELNKINI